MVSCDPSREPPHKLHPSLNPLILYLSCASVARKSDTDQITLILAPGFITAAHYTTLMRRLQPTAGARVNRSLCICIPTRAIRAQSRLYANRVAREGPMPPILTVPTCLFKVSRASVLVQPPACYAMPPPAPAVFVLFLTSFRMRQGLERTHYQLQPSLAKCACVEGHFFRGPLMTACAYSGRTFFCACLRVCEAPAAVARYVVFCACGSGHYRGGTGVSEERRGEERGRGKREREQRGTVTQTVTFCDLACCI